FDVDGRCRETPAEPEGSRLCERVRQAAYPVREANGAIWAYLGPGEPPALPRLDCFAAPDEYGFAFKGHIDCNWLQALEVGIDPAHASFLHRFFADEEPGAGYGKQFRAASIDSETPMSRILREFPRPRIEIDNTDFGLRLTALRRLDAALMHVRVTNLIFPHAVLIPLSETMTITQWHVPIDDENCYWYALFTSFRDPIDKDEMRRQRLELYTLPDYKPRKNRANDWGFDAAEQQTETFTGMGRDINVHDNWAVESQGKIHDRTREHLGQSDKGVMAYRRLLLDALAKAEADEAPLLSRPNGHSLPVTVDGIAPANEWNACWREADAKRRRDAPWPAPTP
ncbi:MAG: aromatic ring-hydroxylating dioxygenase subunit alpha, partial [Stellaceae bacterium]